MSIKDPQCGNDYMSIPEVYKPLARTARVEFPLNFIRNFLQCALNMLLFESHVLTLIFQLMKAQAPAEMS